MPQNKHRLLLLSLVLALLTIVFTIIVNSNKMDTIDYSTQPLLTSWNSPIMTKHLYRNHLLAYTKMLFLLSVLIGAWLLMKKRLYSLFLYCWMMGGASIITFCMKILIERDRPGDISYVDFWGLGNHIISYSYPSGHAVKGFLYFAFIIYLIRSQVKKAVIRNVFTIMLSILILLIGLGQILLDRHYLSDVIGGYLVAATWLTVSIAIIRPFWIISDRSI